VSPIHVEVREEPSKLAQLARGVPRSVRRPPAWSGLWRAALAFLPSPLLLVAFSLPVVAAVWAAGAALIAMIFFAIEQEPPAGLPPARISVDEHGVVIERSTQSERWRPAELRDVVALTDAIVLVSHRDGWLVIPRASFDSPETCERFVAAARAHMLAAVPTPGWPKRSPLEFGAIAFLLCCAGGLSWLAWDAAFWQRLPCAVLAGVCLMLATADMSSKSPRQLMGRRAGRPTPPRPGNTTEAYLAAVRIEVLRPSAQLVLGVYALAAALLYVTLVAEVIGSVICVSLSLVVLAFATFELSSVFEMWWPSRPLRSWRQIEVTSLGVMRRHAGGSVTVPWAQLKEPSIRDGAICLERSSGEIFETIRESEFAQPEDRDAFVAVARSRGAG
jgi:hypothetical protein